MKEIDIMDFENYFTWTSKTATHAKQAAVKTAKNSYELIVENTQIYNYPYIAINKYHYTILHVDVDFRNKDIEKNYYAGFDDATFDDHLIPCPNITIHDSEESFHCIWFLTKRFPKTASIETIKYFRNMRLKIITALKGDPNCNINCFSKNPFYQNYKTRIFHENTFEFGDFDIDTKLNKNIITKNFNDNIEEGRNKRLFNYALSKFKNNILINFEELFCDAKEFSNENFQAKLSDNEISSICRSVLRNGAQYNVRAERNYGSMGMEPLEFEKGVGKEVRIAAIRKRQSIGANYTHTIRKINTHKKIYDALDDLQKNNAKISIASISQKTGLNRKTISKYVTKVNRIIKLNPMYDSSM